MTIEITVVIPSIVTRALTTLPRAVDSVMKQTLMPRTLIVQHDLNGEGSAITRNRALASVVTPWVAFLDDDDKFLRHHLDVLARQITDDDADVAYSLPFVVGPDGREVRRRWEWGGGPKFDGPTLEQRSYITVCSLVRTDLAVGVGGFEFKRNPNGQLNDDHGFYVKLYRAGAQFTHVHEQTFIWYHHGSNTSGRPERVAR